MLLIEILAFIGLFMLVLMMVILLVSTPTIVKVTYHGDDWFTVHYSDKTVIVAHYDCDVWYKDAETQQGAQVTLQSGEVRQSNGPRSLPMQIRYARECHQRLQSLPKIPDAIQKETGSLFPKG